MENPRVNIDLVSGFFEFYYRTLPSDEGLGQVLSKAMITYRQEDEKSQAITEMTPCVIFTKGIKILELLIYMPIQEFTFIKELKYFFHPKMHGECVICLDRKENVINVHNNQFEHLVCMNCLIKIDRCPVCRLQLG